MTTTTNPNKALWEKGDFTQIAATMRDSGEALVEELGITDGMQVLDLGCGDGTTALPGPGWAPTCSASTSPSNLVAAGNARAKELGSTTCRFQEGDATRPERARRRRASTSWSASSARCSRPSRSTSPRRWCG